MGWKNVKEHFEIGHIVQISEKGICIGSGYVHDLATIELETGKVVENSTFDTFLRKQYPALLEAAPGDILRLINEPDTFEAAIPVYTYGDGEIIEKRCEALGWPNVTHDGMVMYDNTFSSDKAKVVAMAKRDADVGIKYGEQAVEEAERRLAECQERLAIQRANREKLEADYPTTGEPQC